MIEISDAVKIHATLIEKFGGTNGIRDRGALAAALARPFATFDNQDLHPGGVEKAAALFESLIINHPFLDGNKRIAYTLMRLTLLEHNLDLTASQQDKYDMVISASTGAFRFEEIVGWLNQRVK